ncbi:MAG: DNA recombination protein RmuC [Actinobacteria bacterium]|nr:DNA recombination protein RmuC [Actinomycetota bacterium]
MDTFLILLVGLAIGVLLGAVLGFLFADSRAKSRAASLAAAQSQEQLAQQGQESKLLEAIAPVRFHLEQMQQVVTRLEKDRTEQFGTIQEQLKNAIDSDAALRKQTQALSQALSSNNIRGVWGETQLRKLVELAGLIKHADFSEQASFSTDTGSGRADMVINLPGGKSLAIDSKVPFNAYQEASTISDLSSGEELARRKRLIEEHVKAVKSHVDALSSKSYWSGLSASPDFVIAFVPSESLLSAALDADAGLLEYAFKKNVALASPVSLFSVLKTINYIWRQNVDETQVRTMIKLGKELYDRVGKLAEHADKLGRSITASVKDYNIFVSSLESRVLVTARKLNDLDENTLGTEQIPAPAEIEAAAQPLTASELTK